MLGDLGHFSPANVTDGHQFLESLGDRIDASGVALVVGARIGRVSAEVLAPFFAAVDIVERIAACAAAAAGGPGAMEGMEGAGAAGSGGGRGGGGGGCGGGPPGGVGVGVGGGLGVMSTGLRVGAMGAYAGAPDLSPEAAAAPQLRQRALVADALGLPSMGGGR